MNTNPSPPASDALDIQIDRALAGLRDAQPRSGLNGRVLASLQHRTNELGGLPFHNVKGWGIVCGSKRESTFRATHVALSTATCAAILAVCSLAILHHQTTSPAGPHTNTVILSEASHSDANKNHVILSEARGAQSKDPETARRATNADPFSTTALAQTTHTLSSRPERVAHSGETRILDHQIELATDPDAQALADLHAPSHPAPPLPLTAQERLFLRMLRYGNATQLAELNPLVRAQQDADETTAFKAFFPDPPPLKQPGDDE
jgi:hypothetical protein